MGWKKKNKETKKKTIKQTTRGGWAELKRGRSYEVAQNENDEPGAFFSYWSMGG